MRNVSGVADIKRRLNNGRCPKSSSSDSTSTSDTAHYTRPYSSYQRTNYPCPAYCRAPLDRCCGTGKLVLPNGDPDAWPPVGQGTLLLNGMGSESRVTRPRRIAVYLHTDPADVAPTPTPLAVPDAVTLTTPIHEPAPEAAVHEYRDWWAPAPVFDKNEMWRASIDAYLDNSYNHCPPFGSAVIYCVLLMCIIIFYIVIAHVGTSLSPRWAINWVIVASLIIGLYLALGETAKVKAIAFYFTSMQKKLA